MQGMGALPTSSWVDAAYGRVGIRALPDVPAAPAPPLGSERWSGDRFAVLVVRSPHGQVVTYPVALERWNRGALESVLVPAPGLDADDAVGLQRDAIRWATDVGLVGAATVRSSGTQDDAEGRLGCDGSGAWTLDACATNVYENHVRAVLDLPLGAPAMHRATVAACAVRFAPGMFEALRHCMARDPYVRIHLVGVEGTPGMTIGHTCVVADDADDALRRARHAADYLTGTIEE